MALVAPLLTRKRLLQVEIETTKGEVIATTPVDVLVYDSMMNPTDPFVERKGSAKALGHTSPGVLEGTKAGTCTFRTELRANTGTTDLEPGLILLLQACGLSLTTKVYTPISVHATQKTLTMTLYEDGLKKQLIGAAGNFTMTPDSGRIIFDFEFSGVWIAPSDVAIAGITLAYDVGLPISWGNAANAFAMDEKAYKITTFSFTTGNNVIPRFTNGGISYFFVSDRDPTMSMNPESDLIAGSDVFVDWLAGSEVKISLALTDGTNSLTLEADKFQYRELAEGDRDGIAVDEVTGQFNIVTIDTGDDEYKLTAV